MQQPVDVHFSRATRLVHAGLAIAIILQLATAQFMQSPRRDRPGDSIFELHEIFGLLAMALALAFWVVLIMRHRGTEPGRLVPWFSAERRSAMFRDLGRFLSSLRAMRLPRYDPGDAFIPAIQGLGLLLMTFMAASGTLYVLAEWSGMGTGGAIHELMEVHSFFGNLVWAYVIGHAGMAMVHEFIGDLRISQMWSLRRGD
ncbi:MAG: cytochrome b/b6 domain-containing protein [Geminicoccaceae bacterium]|nr:cytochrome b/b6 domain-containing protein [Geminicoccaceae bacterium]